MTNRNRSVEFGVMAFVLLFFMILALGYRLNVMEKRITNIETAGWKANLEYKPGED